MHRHAIIQLVRSGTATTAANQAGPLQHSPAPSSLRLHAWTEIALLVSTRPCEGLGYNSYVVGNIGSSAIHSLL